MRRSLLILCLLIIANISNGKAGPKIPEPSPSLEQATTNAKKFYQEVYIAESNKKEWHEGVFIVSVIYTKLDNGNWNWLVTFRHLKQNDSSVTFKVNQDGTIDPIPVRRTV